MLKYFHNLLCLSQSQIIFPVSIVFIVAAIAICVKYVFQKNKKYWLQVNKAVEIIASKHKVLLIGGMRDVIKMQRGRGTSKTVTKREVAVAIQETCIIIYDCWGGFDDENNFKRTQEFNQNNIKMISCIKDELDEDLILLRIFTKKPLEILDTEHKKKFEFTVSTYSKNITFDDVISIIQNYVAFQAPN